MVAFYKDQIESQLKKAADEDDESDDEDQQ